MTESESIKVNPDTLRATAASLRGVLSEVDAELAEIKSLHETTAREAAIGTVDASPAPYFSPLLDALGATTGKVIKNLEQLKDNITHDAEALVQIADAHEQVEQENAAKITNL